jgi:hypothetical protein
MCSMKDIVLSSFFSLKKKRDIVLFHIERNTGGKSVDMALSGCSSFCRH